MELKSEKLTITKFYSNNLQLPIIVICVPMADSTTENELKFSEFYNKYTLPINLLVIANYICVPDKNMNNPEREDPHKARAMQSVPRSHYHH